jgi:hypothetical protein
MFNSQERTLRESVTLALSAGWKIVRVSRTSGSSFGYMVAVPVTIPPQPQKTLDLRSFKGQRSTEPIETKNQREDSEYDTPTTTHKERKRRDDMEIIERASSRCGTPTFGSNTRLSSMQEALARFGGGMVKPKAISRQKSTPFGGTRPVPPPPLLKPALSLTTTVRKRPSPLSVPPSHGTPSPGHSPRWVTSTSPRNEHTHSSSPAPPPKTITRRMSLANLRPQPLSGSSEPPPTLPTATRQYQPLSPMSPRSAVHPPILRRASHAQLSQIAAAHVQSQQSSNSGTAPLSFIPIRAGGLYSEPPLPSSPAGQIRSGGSLGPPAGISSQLPPKPTMHSRRASNAAQPNSQGSSRKRSGTVVGPYISTSRVNEGSALTPSSSFLRPDSERTTHSRQSSTASRSSLVEGGISVLDVAGRIERGEFTQRTPSP